MQYKRCFKCGIEKAMDEFYKHPAMGDGHLGKCKECTKADTLANRIAKIEYYRQYDKRRASMPHRSELRRRICAKWRIDYPKRRAAQMLVGHAVRSGQLIPQPCFICGEKAEAHHPDYDNPLDIVWLCPAHHKQAHALAKKAA